MKWVLAALILLGVSVVLADTPSGIDLVLNCWNGSQAEAGYVNHTDNMVSGSSYFVADGFSIRVDDINALQPGEHRGVVAFDLWKPGQVVIWEFVTESGEVSSLVIDSDQAAPDCDADSGEQTAAVTLYDPPCNPCFWEIQDEYGTWSAVDVPPTPVEFDADGRAFTRLTVVNGITDPARYRVR